MRNYLVFFTLVILCQACDDNSFEIDNTSRDILTEMLDIAREHALHKDNIAWDNVTNSVYSEFERSGFQPAVRVLLRALSDSHSFYRFENWIYRESFITCNPSNLAITDLPDNIGYVAVGPFGSTSDTDEEAKAFSSQIQSTLEAGRQKGVEGWVVDLTGNTGGSMFPMIAGIGPLLGDGIHGYFIDPDDDPIPWGYEDGKAYAPSPSDVIAVVSDPISTFDTRIKVAVIIDNQTASAGEATAISFIGRPNTRIFGEASCGLSTGNSLFELSNGADFLLTTAVMADREQNAFGEKIFPDEIFSNALELEQRVTTWLLED